MRGSTVSTPSIVTLTLAVCAAACVPAPVVASQVDGEWGGARAKLVVDSKGAVLEIPCGVVRIEGAISIDAEGRFDVPAAYRRLHGTIPAEPADGKAEAAGPADENVRVRGRVVKNGMTLSIDFGEGQSKSETFKLERGAAAHVPSCG